MELVPGPTTEIGPRRPRPDRRLDLLRALGVATAAGLVYVAALVVHAVPPRGLAVVFFAAAPVSAGFALVVLAARARAERDVSLAWVSGGLAVGWVAMLLQLVSFPQVAAEGGPLGTSSEGSATLYLWFHLSLALFAVAGALRAPLAALLPATAAGTVAAMLLAVDAVRFPELLRPDGSYTTALVVAEYATAAVAAVSAWVWLEHAGRSAPALRGWVGVALSLSVFDLVLNALGAQRFTEVWWASLSLRVATYAVLAVGALVSVLGALRDVEAYSADELDRREGQLRRSLRATSRLLTSAEVLSGAVTPAEAAGLLCRGALDATGMAGASLLVVRSGRTMELLGHAGDDLSGAADSVLPAGIGWDEARPGPAAVPLSEPVFLTGTAQVQERFPGVASTPLRRAAALAALPIRAGDEELGVLVVWDAEPRPWPPLERELLAGMAAQGAQAIRRAQAFENEATAAATLQRSLLPSALPHRQDMTLAARYVAGETGLRVGGDWYDCLELDGGDLALVVGDVMGKGLRAASLMGQIRTSLRSLAVVDPSPSAVLRGLDRLTADLDVYEIATVCYVLVEVGRGRARVARAGHLPPLLVGPDGRARLLEEGGSPPLGSPVAVRPEAEVAVAPGSLFVLYTDGIVETRTSGLDELPAFIADVECAARAAAGDPDRAATAILEQAGRPGRSDDVALLLAQCSGVSAAAPVPPRQRMAGGAESLVVED